MWFSRMESNYLRWKARLSVSAMMLVLALLGVILLNIHAKGFWIYCESMSVIYAMLSIGLFCYLNRAPFKFHHICVWHQLLHWLGLLITVYLINIFVRTGLLDTTQAGLVTLTCLALTLYLLGVYTDIALMVIGIMLMLIAAASVLFASELWMFMVPLFIIVTGIIYVIVHREKNRA